MLHFRPLTQTLPPPPVRQQIVLRDVDHGLLVLFFFWTKGFLCKTFCWLCWFDLIRLCTLECHVSLQKAFKPSKVNKLLKPFLLYMFLDFCTIPWHLTADLQVQHLQWEIENLIRYYPAINASKLQVSVEFKLFYGIASSSYVFLTEVGWNADPELRVIQDRSVWVSLPLVNVRCGRTSYFVNSLLYCWHSCFSHFSKNPGNILCCVCAVGSTFAFFGNAQFPLLLSHKQTRERFCSVCLISHPASLWIINHCSDRRGPKALKLLSIVTTS